MSETYVCDRCDARISSGFTICYAPKLTDSPTGVELAHTNETINLCSDCFPDSQDSQKGVVRCLREVLGYE